MKATALRVVALLALSGTLAAQTVTLSGMLGQQALLIVDGQAPKGVAPGQTHRGVKVISTVGDQAVLEFGGARHTLRVGDAPASVGSGAGAGVSGNRVVLFAGSGGHFVTHGQINGHRVPFVVDTGATFVSLGAAQADLVGLNYKAGQRVQMSTANGLSNGWRLRLATVKLGDVVVYDVDAVVTPASMPVVLLGNSFLSRFQMTRTNEQMVLDKRY